MLVAASAAPKAVGGEVVPAEVSLVGLPTPRVKVGLVEGMNARAVAAVVGTAVTLAAERPVHHSTPAGRSPKAGFPG